jgi:hypothetical protein
MQPCYVIDCRKRFRSPARFVGLQLLVICNLPSRELAGKIIRG